MTALGQVLIATSVLACGIIYGTDVFSAIVLRPALALVDDRTLVSIMGRVHDFGDRKLRVPGVATILGTVVVAWAGHLAATVAGAIAVVALACWLIIYARISAPINSRLTAASQRDETPADARLLQRRWDSVITPRSGLQMLAILSLAQRS